MAAPQAKQWGLLAAISTALPTEKDLELNEALLKELKAQNNFESTEGTEKRATILARVQNITEEFVRHVGRLKGLPQSVIDTAGGLVTTFGSYRLGVYGPGSDIDTCILAPKHVTRDDFFEHFPTLLEKMSPPGAIEELTPVPDAHVPIIKVEYSGISIDLIFTRLALSSVPKDIDLKNNNLLRGMDDVDMRSINGARVADEMVSLVPQMKTFRQALRAIKLWAERRGIYGNVMGFPGGVAWALLTARICQLYPMACGSTIAIKFFHLIKMWPWPKPVMLKEIEDGPTGARTWNPQIYRGDKAHLMPIITPAYPSMCATHNITYSTKKIITREIERASEIANQIMDKKLQWKDLFQPHTFFTKDYKYYLSVIAGSRTEEAQLIWSGLVQSKVRKLVTGIEQSEAGVELAHPFKSGFKRVHRCRTEEEVDLIFQGDMRWLVSDTEPKTTDEEKDIKQTVVAEGAGDKLEMPTANGSNTNSDGTISIYTTTFYIGIELQEGAKQLDITYPVADFKRQCQDWQQYNSELNSIRIVHTRNYDLPADLFKPSEARPTKVKKAKTAKSSQTKPAVKRSFNDTGMEGAEASGAKRQISSNGTAASPNGTVLNPAG